MNMIVDEGGMPTRLALFPKSMLAIKNCELSLILNKVIEASTISTENPDWAINLYKRVLTT
jgi:hypothetical protein